MKPLWFVVALILSNSVCDASPSSFYLARVSDEKNNNRTSTKKGMDGIMAVIRRAERRNRSLTDREVEMISNDYEDKCQCLCKVHVGDIINEVKSKEYTDYR